jgi:AraC-like DNA-binding protein
MLDYRCFMLYRPNMEPDDLSAVLSRLRLKTSFQNAFDAAGRWGIEVPPHRGIKIHTVLRGRCWLSVAGSGEPKEVREGDCYLLPRGGAFLIASDPSISCEVPGQQVRARDNRGIATVNGGGGCTVSGVYFDFESPLADIIFGSLPALVFVGGTSSHAAGLRRNLQRFAAEFNGSSMGRSLIMYQLAPIMLLDIIRTFLSENPGNSTWFGALVDDSLSRVLGIMHTEYGRRWTLEELAAFAGVSRSKLAADFRRRIGIAPMEYLGRWRMDVAREMLSSGQLTISAVSQAVGYESESAFSTACKRILGKRPGFYRKRG